MSVVRGKGPAAQRSSWAETGFDGDQPIHEKSPERIRFEEWKAREQQRFSDIDECAEGVRAAASFDPRGYYVYVLWSEDDACVYVGCSTNILARLGTHMAPGNKGSAVAKVTLTRCDDKKTMLLLERRLISALRPRYNVAHNAAGVL